MLGWNAAVGKVNFFLPDGGMQMALLGEGGGNVEFQKFPLMEGGWTASAKAMMPPVLLSHLKDRARSIEVKILIKFSVLMNCTKTKVSITMQGDTYLGARGWMMIMIIVVIILVIVHVGVSADVTRARPRR